MTTPSEPAPIRKSSLPTTPPAEWQFSTVLATRPDGLPGCFLLPGDMGGGVVRRRVQYSDWEPVRPDHWAEEPLTLNDAIAHWNEYDEQRDQEKNGEESPGQELAALRAEVAAARTFAAEMRDFCSPHGVATDYADRLIEAMDRARAAGLPSGAREVRVVVRAPSDENAGQWAQTIRDLVLAEYGDSMRLEVTITPGGQA